ncbi:MAG TPA: alpha/beta hydrolase, partial [Roseiflexaceae bacterium]|nr:alpha/beta hydrolase [Roseiflexaceae bacterium]
MNPTDTFLTLDHLRLHLRDWGGPQDAQPILLVHGLASNARIWDLVAPLLAGEFRVAAIDQRGHGLSDKPADGYNFSTVARDLAVAIGALGWHQPLVVGHSWGANVALQLAADAPDVPGGIVLLDGGTNELASIMSLEQTLERLAPPRLAGMQRAAFVEMLRSRWAGSAWSQPLEDAIMGNFAAVDAERIAPNLTYENHMTIVRAMWDQRPTQLFTQVTCPTLIIPAEPPASDERGQEWLELKRRSVESAAAAI